MSWVSKRGLELLVFQDMRSHTCTLTDTYHVVHTCMPACVQGYISRGGVRVHRTPRRKSLPEERIFEDAIKKKSESHRWINERIKGGWNKKGYVLQYIWNVLATRDVFDKARYMSLKDSRFHMLNWLHSLIHANCKNWIKNKSMFWKTKLLKLNVTRGKNKLSLLIDYFN